MQHRLADEVGHAPKGINPELDPTTLDLYDPRNPLNQRRRQNDKKPSKPRKERLVDRSRRDYRR